VPAAPDHAAFESKFQVLGRPEADLLNMYPGVDRIGMAGQRSNQKVIAEGACNIRKARNVQRFDSVDSERVDIFGVVGIGHASAESRPQPLVLFSERDFVVEK